MLGDGLTIAKVIGEALAFVIGCTAKDMRAKTLSSLLNENLRQSSIKASAKVSVTLQTPCKLVKLSRVMTRSSSCYYLKSDGLKRQVLLTDMKQALGSFGIAADILDRFIVMQSRQAIKATQPLELCEYLQVIFGVVHYEDNIKVLETEIFQMSMESSALHERLAEVQAKIEMLQPEVDKWKRFDKQWRHFQQKKAAYLKSQCKLIGQALQQNKVQLDKKHAALLNAKEQNNALQEAQCSLNSTICKLRNLIHSQQKDLDLVEKCFYDHRSKMLKAEVRFTAIKNDGVALNQMLMEVHEQQGALKEELASLSRGLYELEGRSNHLKEQIELLKENKAKACVQHLGVEGMIHANTEDLEDERTERMLELQV